MNKLKVFQVINDPGRNSAVDVFRGLAIIAVVIYHFNHRLPFGFLGVDLFFVVSGLLVGGLLTKQYKAGKPISFPKFVLQRGFKIWPSYYAFIFLGTLVAILFYRGVDDRQIIPLWDMPRYLFFYQNYTGQPLHRSFDHVWSVCVEEHFYILLPIMFLVVQHFIPQRLKMRSLYFFVISTILAGIVFKFISYYFTESQATFAGTHNRLDALAWGVLLNLLINWHGERVRTFAYKIPVFLAGLFIFVAALLVYIFSENVVFQKVYFHSITPFCFFLMLFSTYYMNLYRLKAIRFVAYYSYNWYLWHPLFVMFLTRVWGDSIPALILYVLITFAVAMLATILIEEPVLGARKRVLDRLFPPPPKPAMQPRPVIQKKGATLGALGK